MRAPTLSLVTILLAACQPTVLDIQYDKEAPLYGSDDDPGGSTGAGGSSGGGGSAVDPDEPIAGTFMMSHESDGGYTGAVSCEAWWGVTGEPASTECPDCGFTLDWAYTMTYTLDEDSVSLPAGCEYTTPGYVAGSGSYGDQILEMNLGKWGLSSDYVGYYGDGDGQQFLVGYAYYGYEGWRPMYGTEVEVSDSGMEWRWVDSFTYGGYYDYYDDAADEYTVTQTWAGSVSGQ